MSEHVTLFLLVLTSSAGILLAYRVASSELRRLWERRKGNPRPEPVSWPLLHESPVEKQTMQLTGTVRGYDSPELFCLDTIIRIRELQKQIIRPPARV